VTNDDTERSGAFSFIGRHQPSGGSTSHFFLHAQRKEDALIDQQLQLREEK
jgi:hypothetical protein